MNIIERVALLIMGLAVGYMIIILIVGMPAQARCLSQGYPSHKITYDFKNYCIKSFGDITTVKELP